MLISMEKGVKNEVLCLRDIDATSTKDRNHIDDKVV